MKSNQICTIRDKKVTVIVMVAPSSRANKNRSCMVRLVWMIKYENIMIELAMPGMHFKTIGTNFLFRKAEELYVYEMVLEDINKDKILFGTNCCDQR